MTKGITIKAKHTTLAERVLKHMKKKYGIVLPSRPLDEDGDEYVPMLPPDITALPGIDLGRIQGQFSAYADYVEGVLAASDMDRLESEDQDKEEAARQRLIRLNDEGSTVKSREDDAFLDPTARRKRIAQLERRARYTFLNARLNQLDRAMKVLSREQSRREAELARRET